MTERPSTPPPPVQSPAVLAYVGQPLVARLSWSALRAAMWTVRALRAARRDLPTQGVQAAVLAPPKLPAGARRGVDAVLRRQSPTCLERALVLQCWLAAHDVPADVVVGVSRRTGDVAAHAWLSVEAPPAVDEGFVELHRLPPR